MIESLSDLQRCFGPGDARPLHRPDGSFRTRRCEHGMRCDSEPIHGAQWLCTVCPCPWTRPVDGEPRPSDLALRVLEKLARGTSTRNSDTVDLILAALSRCGLIYGRRLTPAGKSVVLGVDFWASAP